MHIEVEQKFRVTDAAALQAKLRTLDCDIDRTAAQEQIDRYFAHPARDFAATDEALRVRRVGESNCITYKGPKLDATTKTRRELEIDLPSGESGFTSACELLTALGFQPVADVGKHRRACHVTFQDRAVEVCWDEVKNLGEFVELELLSDDSDVAAARDCLAALSSALGLSASERRSYLELLLSK